MSLRALLVEFSIASCTASLVLLIIVLIYEVLSRSCQVITTDKPRQSNICITMPRSTRHVSALLFTCGLLYLLYILLEMCIRHRSPVSSVRST
jgi:uncharacterized membrane protein